jgi:hypothetical protein
MKVMRGPNTMTKVTSFSLRVPAMLAFVSGLSAYAVSASPGYTQPPPSLTDQIAAWEALPEDPAMRKVCTPYLTYATSISMLLAKHATSAEIMQWERQEIAQKTKQYPTMDPLDIKVGGEMIMNALITPARNDATNLPAHSWRVSTVVLSFMLERTGTEIAIAPLSPGSSRVLHNVASIRRGDGRE